MYSGRGRGGSDPELAGSTDLTAWFAQNSLWLWPITGVVFGVIARAVAARNLSIEILAVGLGLAVTAMMTMPAVVVQRWTKLSADAAANKSQPSADALGLLMGLFVATIVVLLVCCLWERWWGEVARKQTITGPGSFANMVAVGVVLPMLIGVAGIIIVVAAASVHL